MAGFGISGAEPLGSAATRVSKVDLKEMPCDNAR